MTIQHAKHPKRLSEEHDEFGWFSQEEVDAMIDEGLLTPPAANAFKK